MEEQVKPKGMVMKFPDDADGDALRRILAHGDDLSRPRPVDFSVVFPSEETAETFAVAFRKRGYAVDVELKHMRKELPWDVLVVKVMALSYEGLVSFEDEIAAAAGPLGGENDGWGCFSEPEPSDEGA